MLLCQSFMEFPCKEVAQERFTMVEVHECTETIQIYSFFNSDATFKFLLFLLLRCAIILHPFDMGVRIPNTGSSELEEAVNGLDPLEDLILIDLLFLRRRSEE